MNDSRSMRWWGVITLFVIVAISYVDRINISVLITDRDFLSHIGLTTDDRTRQGLLATAFSLVISHVGATIVMVPIAINLALAAGGDPTAFALIVALSASNNLMSASNPVISMVVGPANYTSRQLWRVGGPLSLIYTMVVVLAVNVLFWWNGRAG